MSTLISVYDSNGLVGRCDAKCYNAKHPRCDCICGGRNHGKGREQAINNTHEIAQYYLDTFGQKKQLVIEDNQLSLFPDQPQHGG